LLQIAGSVGAISIGSSIPVEAKANEKQLVKLDIQYRDLPDFPPSHTDNIVPYRFTPKYNQLYVSDWISESENRKVRSDKPLISVNGEALHTTPAVVSDTHPVQLLPVRRGFRRKIDEGYSGPTPRITIDNQKAIVSIGNSTTTISSGDKKELELESVDVIGRPDEGAGEPASFSITPVVKVRNAGRVEIIRPTRAK